MKIDCHVHLVGASPASGGYASPRVTRSVQFRFLARKLGLGRFRDPEERERRYIEMIARWTRESELDRIVLLAFDETYGADGEKDPERTAIYVPNDFVRDICRANPDLFMYGASVHPLRKDALDELERVASDGAVLVKLLPNTQGFDPAAAELAGYFRKLADLAIPMLIHGGFEHTLPVIDQSFGDPARLEQALDLGVTAIVAHAGSAGMMHFKETMGSFLRLADTYQRCYGDTSALGTLWRSKYLKQLLDPDLLRRKYKAAPEDPMSRLVHGSDCPLPVSVVAFSGRIASCDLKRLRRERNPLQREIDLKRLVGVPDACLTRLHDEIGVGRTIGLCGSSD